MPQSRLLSLFLCFCLILEQNVFAQTIDLSHYFARNPAQTIPQSDKFRPLHLRYISYDNQANDFKILLDKGDFFNQKTEKPKNEKTLELEKTTQELMKYFFIGLALPSEKFWVNLRPDSPDNILDPDLEKTDIGRIFLEADLQLKKDTSGMTSPQTKEGKEYWDKLYKKAEELFGTENITIPTLTRPWIVPNEIIIKEAPDNAYIYKATLKVMLEEDYLIGRGGSRTAPTYQQSDFSDPRLKELNQYSTQLIRELIIPKLTRQVNTSKRYAPLRQVYYSLILAQWFKARFADNDTTYSRIINRKDLTNLVSKESWSKNTYFNTYQKSFKDGEYNIQESAYSLYGQTIRSYFSGGISIMSNSPLVEGLKRSIGAVNEAVLPAASSLSLKQYLLSVFYAAGKVYIPTQIPDKVYAVGTSSSLMVKNTEDRQSMSLTQNLDSLDASKFPDFVPSSFPKTAEVFKIIKVVDINAPGAIEPEHDTNIDPQGIVLVHAHAALPKDGILYPNSYHDIRPLGLRNPREIVEFSWNGVIDYWKDNDVVVLVPLKNAPKENFINLWHAATSHFGPFVIPKGSILLIRSGTKVENDSIIGLHEKGIGVIYFPHGLSVNKAVSQVLMQTGYVPMSLNPMGAFEDGSMVSWVDERTGKDCSPRAWNEFDYRYSRYIYRSHYFMSRLAKELNVPFSSEGTGSYDLGLASLKMESISKQLVTNEMWEGDVGIKEFSDKFESAYNLLSSEQKASNSGKRFLAIGKLFSQFLKLSRELNNNSGEDAQRLFAFLQARNDANYRQKRIADSITEINGIYGAEFATSDLQNLDDLFKITRFLTEKDFPGIFDIFEEKDVVHNRKLGNERIGTLSSSLVEPVKRIEDRPQKANMPKSDKGGIDFRSLPIVIQAMSNLSLNTSRIPLSSLESINLDQELQEIQNMFESGFTPSTERIKEYIQIACLKGDLNDMQKIISCIADILRDEEELCSSTEPTLKDILVVLESGRSAQELKAIFTGSRI